MGGTLPPSLSSHRHHFPAFKQRARFRNHGGGIKRVLSTECVRMNIRAKIYGGASAAEEPLLKGKKPRGAKADTLHSVAVSREARRASNGRAEDRHRLTGEKANLTHNGVDLEVELINLSGGGAMVAGA